MYQNSEPDHDFLINPIFIGMSMGIIMIFLLMRQYQILFPVHKKPARHPLIRDTPIKVVRPVVVESNRASVPAITDNADKADNTGKAPYYWLPSSAQSGRVKPPKKADSSSSSSMPLSKVPEPKVELAPLNFQGILLGENPTEIEAKGSAVTSYYYLDKHALDEQKYDYAEFDSFSRMKIAQKSAQEGLVPLKAPLYELKWSFHGEERAPLKVKFELKIFKTKDRILCVEIPGDGATLIVGLVAVHDGLHTNAAKERLEDLLKNTTFAITPPGEQLDVPKSAKKRI